MQSVSVCGMYIRSVASSFILSLLFVSIKVQLKSPRSYYIGHMIEYSLSRLPFIKKLLHILSFLEHSECETTCPFVSVPF